MKIHYKDKIIEAMPFVKTGDVKLVIGEDSGVSPVDGKRYYKEYFWIKQNNVWTKTDYWMFSEKEFIGPAFEFYDYILFVGGAYFTTPFTVCQNIKYEIKLNIKLTGQKSGDIMVMGSFPTNSSWANSKNFSFLFNFNSPYKINCFTGTKTNDGTITGVNDNIDYTIIMDINKNYLIVNGVNYNYPGGIGSITYGGQVLIGSLGTGMTSSDIRFFEGYIYYVKIWQGDTLLADYVPAINIDRQKGFYNNVDDTFLTPTIGSIDVGNK